LKNTDEIYKALHELNINRNKIIEKLDECSITTRDIEETIGKKNFNINFRKRIEHDEINGETWDFAWGPDEASKKSYRILLIHKNNEGVVVKMPYLQTPVETKLRFYIYLKEFLCDFNKHIIELKKEYSGTK